ncbi:MAG TPA: hypothetical protein ENK73_01330 [Thiomicrospira sp.]|jgi:hypothetical protein|nr:hypothetical protein [Thiomicrospira sp.]
MPGSNHDIDSSFMDELPIAVRDAGLELIRYSNLKEMLEMRLEGITPLLESRFNLTQEQWQMVLNTVILTKVSYFQIEVNFPNRYIDKLIEIACFARGLSDANPLNLYQSVVAEHPRFAQWVKNAIKIKQQNIRLTSA